MPIHSLVNLDSRVKSLARRRPADAPARSPGEAFRMNEGGWAEQLLNVERHVATV